VITCPKCRHQFESTDAVKKEVEESLKAGFEVQLENARLEAEEESRKEIDAVIRRASEKVAQAGEMAEARISGERRKAAAEARESLGAELAAANEVLEAQRSKLEAFRTQEVALRRQARELEDAKADMELEVARKLDSERGRIAEEAGARVAEQHAMKQAEWDKTRADLLRQVDEMRRKAEQGSTQLQGEVFELAIEAALREAFQDDLVEEVAKGVTGGDVRQVVRTPGRVPCGMIVWELKRTKSFSDGWLQKLRDNQRAEKAELAVLVTHAMPEGIRSIGQRDGVWVCDPQSAVELAAVLRASLQELAQARRAQVGRAGKAERVWDYLGGPEFRGRVQGLVEALSSMREGVDSERRAMEKIWSRREKELSRAVISAAGFYGDLQGLGTSLQEIPQLSLDVTE